MLIIQKFGGSSLADNARLRRAAGIAAESFFSGNSVVVVVSARGGTTDELLSDAHGINPAPQARELDALLSTGETAGAALMAMQLAALGADSVSLSAQQAGIHTSCSHGNADILGIDTRRIDRELRSGRIAVVAGFQGVSPDGNITTLGRGGSDTTAVALACALNADECRIYSDVDGVYTADPHLVDGAQRLERIDYDDMLALALGGSQVLHSRSVEAARKGKVEVKLLSSFTAGGGTLLTRLDDRPAICGVTRDRALGTVSIVGAAAGSADTLAQAASVLAHSGIIVSETRLFKNGCALTVEPEQLLNALKTVHEHFLRAV